MDRLNVDLRQLERLDVVRFKKRLKSPPQKRFGSIQKTLTNAAIDTAAKVSKYKIIRVVQQISELSDKMKAITVKIRGRSGPMFEVPRGTRVVTVGIGIASAVFSAVGITTGAGLYGSNKPEFGAYSTAGAGCWTNAGVSSEAQIAYVFGPPSDFGGVSWGVAVSAEMPGAGFGLSGQVMFSVNGPPFRMLGFTAGISVGVSVLPVDVSLTVSHTKLLPK